jgi:heme-degrading monooxygenase HmoA
VSVLVIVDLKAKAGSADELRTFLNPAQIRAYEGNEGVELTVNHDDATNLLLVEHWASREAYEAYRAWRVEVGDQATLEGMLEGGAEGVTVRVFDVAETARIRRGDRMEGLEDLEEWAKRWLTLRAEIRALADQSLSAEHLGPVIKLHNEELDSIMKAIADASE